MCALAHTYVIHRKSGADIDLTAMFFLKEKEAIRHSRNRVSIGGRTTG